MSLGIKINMYGEMEQILIDEIMDFIRFNHSNGDYRLVERYVYNNSYVYIYGNTNLSLPFNRYEFQGSVLNGDAFVLRISNPDEEYCEFIDFYIHEFKNWYEDVVDITVTDDEEEESYDSENTSDRDFISDNDDMPGW